MPPWLSVYLGRSRWSACSFIGKIEGGKGKIWGRHSSLRFGACEDKWCYSVPICMSLSVCLSRCVCPVNQRVDFMLTCYFNLLAVLFCDCGQRVMRAWTRARLKSFSKWKSKQVTHHIYFWASIRIGKAYLQRTRHHKTLHADASSFQNPYCALLHPD